MKETGDSNLITRNLTATLFIGCLCLILGSSLVINVLLSTPNLTEKMANLNFGIRAGGRLWVPYDDEHSYPLSGRLSEPGNTTIQHIEDFLNSLSIINSFSVWISSIQKAINWI